MPCMLLFSADEQELKLAEMCGLTREDGMFSAYDRVYGTEEQLTVFSIKRTLLRPEWYEQIVRSRLSRRRPPTWQQTPN